MPKILLVITQMEFGGAQKVMMQLARGLKDKGYKVTVVTWYDKGNFIPEFEKIYGIPITSLNMDPHIKGSKIAKLWRILAGFMRLYIIMRNGKFDILQTETHYSNIFVPPIAFAARIPLRFSSQHSINIVFPKWVKLLDRIVANSRLVKKMVCVSDAVRKASVEYENINPDRLVTIHNGIDLAEVKRQLYAEEKRALYDELGINENNLVISTIARLHYAKGHKYLLEAAEKLITDFPQIRFLLAGEGELKAEIQSALKAIGLEKNVQVLGDRKDVSAILQISDIFVLPSLSEGLPVSILEAMAHEVAVVATNVGGSAEVVEDGKTGLLVPAQNSAELSEAITILAKDKNKRQEMGKAGLMLVKNNFTLEGFINKFDVLYKKHLDT